MLTIGFRYRQVLGRATRRNGLLALAVASAAASSSPAAHATVQDWVGSASTGWATASNWVVAAPNNDIAPDQAQFDQASYVNQPVLPAGTAINGFIFGDASGKLMNASGTLTTAGTAAAVTITGSRPDVGSGGIVMNANSGAATISTGIRMLSSQVWSNASSSVLTIGGGVARHTDLNDVSATLSISNTGTGSVVTGLANDTSGMLGPWVTYTNTVGTYYATNTGTGTVGAYTGGTAATSASSLTSATTNYDLTISGTNILTGSAVANTVRFAGAASTLQINGAGTLTTSGILNATGGKLSIAAGPGATGGVIMGPTQETVILPTTGSIDVGAAIINPATNVGQRYSLTIGGGPGGGGPYIVGVNNVVNDSGDGSILIISGPVGASIPEADNDSGNFLSIGASKNLTLNAATGDIYLGEGPAPQDNDTGGPTDLGITESIPGSTVTIMSSPGHRVGLTGNSTVTGGFILTPGASVYINAWSTGGAAFGTGPITFMGNNTVSKYLNGLFITYNNRINLDGNLEFTGQPPGNAHPWGGSNNYINFVQGSNSGTGEVHLGASVTIDTDTPTTPQTPAYLPTSDQMGGIFDDGHGYGITKTGNGTMYFAGSDVYGDAISSDFTGPLTVLQGTLQLGQFGPASAGISNRDVVVTVDTAGTFYVNNGVERIAGLNDGPTGGGTAFTNAGIIFSGPGTYAFSGALTGTAGYGKDSIGTQTLSGTNTYTGGTSVNGGTLNLNFGGAGTPPTVDILYHGIASNTLSLGGGTLQLTGANGAANSQTVTQLALTANGSNVNLVLNGATSLVLSTGNVSRAGSGATVNFTLPTGPQSATNGVRTTAANDSSGLIGGYATVTAGGTTDWATVSGATHVAPGVNAETDPGTWDNLLTATTFYTNLAVPAANTPISFNTITGNAGITAGNIYFVGGLSGVLGSLNYFTVSATPGGALINPTDSNGTESIDTQGNVIAYSNYAAFAGSGGPSSANVLLTGSGSVTASEAFRNLKITTSGAGQSLSIAAGQTLSLVGGGLLFTGANDYSVTGGGLASLSSELIVQQFGTGNLTLSAPYGGTAFTKSGPGKLTLTATNTFTGAASLNGGVVNINTLGALGNGNAISFSGSTLQYATGFAGNSDITTTANGSAGRSVVINGDGATIDTNGNNVTFANAYGFQNGINGTGGLTKVGAGSLTLDSENGYAGATTISGGTLIVGPDALIVNGGAANQIATAGTNPAYDSAIGKSSYAAENLILDGGGLQYLGAATSTDRNFTLTQNGGTLDSSNASNAALAFTNTSSIATTGSGARTLTLTGSSTGANALDLGIVDGTGGATSVVKNGAGTWLLNGTSTYTGTTTVNSGTLGGSGTLASTVVAGSAAHTLAPSADLASNAATTFTAGGLTTNANTTISLNLVTPGTSHTGAGSVNDAINTTANNGLTLNGGKLAIANTSTGAASLGYYRIMKYSGSIQGTGVSSLTLPAVANKVAYTLSTTQDPGYLDVHRGLLGDANDDGLVNFADFVVLSNNFGLSNKGWSGGDFNADGITNFADFVILSNNFGATIGSNEVASAGAGATSGVPEPTSLALLGAGLLGVIGARRRNRH